MSRPTRRSRARRPLVLALACGMILAPSAAGRAAAGEGDREASRSQPAQLEGTALGPGVAFAERYGAAGVASGSAVLARAPTGPITPESSAGVAERGPSGRGEVLGDSARGSSAARGDGQSSYVGPAPAPTGASLPLAARSVSGGNGQAMEVRQALGLLGLALLLTLVVKYRLSDPGPTGADRSPRPGAAGGPAARAGRAEPEDPSRTGSISAPAGEPAVGAPASSTRANGATSPSANGAAARSTVGAAGAAGARPWRERPRARQLKRFLYRP